MAFDFRPSEPADAAVIAQLCERVLDVPAGSPVFSAAHMHWKYWNPWPTWRGSRSYLLLQDAQPIAHAALVPLHFSIAGCTYTLVQLIDWAAEPRHVGAGVALLKRMAALADGAVSVRGSTMTRRILAPIGFRSFGETMRYAAKPRAAALPLHASLARESKLEIHEHGHFTAREHPLRHAESSAGQIIFQRSAQQIEAWTACPVAPMRYVEVFHADRLIGTFILCTTPEQARIVDVWADSTIEGAWDATIEHAYVQGSAQPDAREVVAQTNDADQAAALRKSGFVAAGADPLAILAKPELVPTGAFVRHHLTDTDLAYLHHGEFLAWLS